VLKGLAAVMVKVRSFHKRIPVRVHRKRLFRKSEWHDAVLAEVSRTGGRLLTCEALLEGYQVGIAIVDPDVQIERELPARVTRVGTLDYKGRRIFEVHVEFLRLTQADLIMLENLFYT
jgi:hypothetical protein